MDKPKFYSILPAYVRYSKELTSLEKLLYSEITCLTEREGYCFAKNSYFAGVFGVSERTVSRMIGRLAKAGFIVLEILDGHERKIYLRDSENLRDAEDKVDIGDEVLERPFEQTPERSREQEGVDNSDYIDKADLGDRKKCLPPVDTTTRIDNINNNINKIYHSVLDDLNSVCGAHFRDSTKARKHIVARIKEGYSLNDFKIVIRGQYALWGNDTLMCRYLRPETLFGSKFSGYLEGARMAKRAESENAFKGTLQKSGHEGVPESVIDERMKFFENRKNKKGARDL